MYEELTIYIAVCDDEQADREQIAGLAAEICEMEKIHAEISCYANAEKLLQELEKGKNNDLLLMDVVMPVQNGIPPFDGRIGRNAFESGLYPVPSEFFSELPLCS